MRSDINHQGRVRPIFRFLAAFLAVAAGFVFIMFVSHLDIAQTTTQEFWELCVFLFMAVFFSVAAVVGKVPRWMYRMIPHSWAWERRDDKHDT